MTKVLIRRNPDFDFVLSILGGFDDIPTKQDKFKPVKYINPTHENEKGETVRITDELYVVNEKKKLGQQNFEFNLKKEVITELDNSHPYKKPEPLEVVIAVNMTSKRLLTVDIDNLVKCILDCLNGLVYEDDSQIVNIIARKNVIEDSFVPQISGVWIGVRKLLGGESVLHSPPLFYMEKYEEE